MEDKNKLLIFKLNVLEKDNNNEVCRGILEPNHNNKKTRNNNNVKVNIPISVRSDGEFETDKVKVSTPENSCRGQQPLHTQVKTNNNKSACNVSNKYSDILKQGSHSEQKRKTGIHREKIIKGTRTINNENSFVGVKPKVWIHLGKVKLKTSEEEIKSHLKLIFPGRSFIVEAMQTRNGAHSMAFKIGGDMDLKDELYNSENWPSGVTVRRFTFFRKNPVSETPER